MLHHFIYVKWVHVLKTWQFYIEGNNFFSVKRLDKNRKQKIEDQKTYQCVKPDFYHADINFNMVYIGNGD